VTPRRKGKWHPLLRKLMEFAIRNPKPARKLVREHPEVLALRTGLDETALHYLAVEDYAEAVALLIELGAEVDTVNHCGNTALDEALIVEAVDTVAVLRRAGAKQSPPRSREEGN